MTAMTSHHAAEPTPAPDTGPDAEPGTGPAPGPAAAADRTVDAARTARSVLRGWPQDGRTDARPARTASTRKR